MKRCYLVRHAQTAWNEENRIQGHSDLPLSPLGRRQAQCVAEFFTSRQLEGIVTSHLQRSRATAEAIVTSNGHRLDPHVEPDFAEMHLGAWEGLTPEQVDVRFRGAYQQWRVRPSSVIIPEAELVDAFRTRVRRGLANLLSRFEEGECVVVSHGGVIASLLADVLNADYDALLRRLRLDNAGITALEFGEGLPHVLWINWTAHLESLAPAATMPGGWF